MLKSAYELALEKTGGLSGRQLTGEDKKRFSEIESKYTARIAELEILHAQKLREVRAAGDAEAFAALSERFAAEKAELREKKEAEKEKARRG